MDPFEMLRQMGIFARVSLVVGILPVPLAIAYAIWPSERRLALMRPLSLASLFGGIAGTLRGGVSILQGIAATGLPPGPGNYGAVAAGAGEALVAVVFSLTCLMVAWLLVTVGMLRGASEG